MKHKIIILLPILMLALGGKLSAQSRELTLEEAITRALDNNAGLNAQVSRVESSEQLKKTSWNIPKTSLIYFAEEQRAGIDGIRSFGFSQNLRWPGYYVNRRNLFETLVNQERAGLTAKENQVILRLTCNFYLLNTMRSKINLYNRIDSLSEQFVFAATERYNVGEGRQLDVLNANALLNEIKGILARLNAREKAVLAELVSIIQPEDTLDFQYVRPAKIPLESTLNEKAEHPLLERNRSIVESTKAIQGLRKAYFYPDFNFQYYGQNVDGQSGFYGFQVGINVPIWFFANQKSLSVARISEQVAEHNYSESGYKVDALFQKLVSQYEQLNENLQFFEETSLPLASELIAAANTGYQEGETSLLEYIISLRQSLEITNNYLDLLQSYNEIVLNLNYFEGNEIQ